jgi:hypothetical protein
MKNKWLVGLCVLLIGGFVLASCGETDPGGGGGDGTGILGFGYHSFGSGGGYSGIVVKVTPVSDHDDYTITIDGAEVEIVFDQFDTYNNILSAGWPNDPPYVEGQNYTVKVVSSPTGFTAEKSIAFDSSFDWFEFEEH